MRGLVAVGQGGDEVVGVGHAGGVFHRLVAGLRVAKADVFGDGAGEEEGVLRHQADLAAQRGLGHRAHVDAVDAHRALADLVEARHQVGDGGLAGAGRADQGHASAPARCPG